MASPVLGGGVLSGRVLGCERPQLGQKVCKDWCVSRLTSDKIGSHMRVRVQKPWNSEH
jgi:hypothetical protein